MISRKGKYITGNVCNQIEKHLQNWKAKSFWGLYSSEDILNFANNEIPEKNMKCNIFISELWNFMSKQIELLKELHILVRVLNKIDKNLEIACLVLVKNSLEN